MKREISCAVKFLTELISKNGKLSTNELDDFKLLLTSLLAERYVAHWYEKYPYKGQAYRCIRVRADEPLDPVLAILFNKIKTINLDKLGLPNGFSLWIDPGEVSCRYFLKILFYTL